MKTKRQYTKIFGMPRKQCSEQFIGKQKVFMFKKTHKTHLKSIIKPSTLRNQKEKQTKSSKASRRKEIKAEIDNLKEKLQKINKVKKAVSLKRSTKN